MSAEWPAYTRSERMADAMVHICGLTGAMLCVPVLIALTVAQGNTAAMIAAVSVYCASLVAMLGFSACYNMLDAPRLRDLLRRLDQAAIYAKIAGTYTPFAAVAGGVLGVWLTVGLWSAAVVGILTRLLAPGRLEKLSLALYLGMGWTFVLVAGPMSEALSGTTLWLILVGGIVYTTGVIFHLWTGLRYHNAIWHVFVLAGTALFFAAVSIEALAPRTSL